jgi:hypothetical protein
LSTTYGSGDVCHIRIGVDGFTTTMEHKAEPLGDEPERDLEMAWHVRIRRLNH